MDSIKLKIALTAFLFIGMVLTGIFLRRGGKPYSTTVFTLHKLISISIILISILAISTVLKITRSDRVDIITIIIAGSLYLIGFVTGVLQSFERPAPGFVNLIHKRLTVFIVLSIFITYAILNNHLT